MGDRLRPGTPSRYTSASEVTTLWRYTNLFIIIIIIIIITSQLGQLSLHPSGVAKSSTSFGWDSGGKVTSAGWQVTLCDPIWHVRSRSGVAG